MDAINRLHDEIFDFYYKALMPLTNDGHLRLAYVLNDCETNRHPFYIILEDGKIRNVLVAHLKSRGILGGLFIERKFDFFRII